VRILVTGASGFIGNLLVRALQTAGQKVMAASRARVESPGIFYVPSPELGPEADWAKALDGADIVVHLAARAHFVDGKKVGKNVAIYQRANTEGAARLAQQAMAVGIRHFIFVSSIGAIAENSNTPLNPFAQDTPVTPYGRSKLAAEKAIKEMSSGTKMNYTIIRPPLVYGPGNPGNMARLLKIADTSLPLPLSALDSNRRSFVSVSNLIDLILLCLEHPAAANQTFHVSDDDDISTAELLRRMGKALGKPVRNIPIPGSLLRAGLRMVGKGDWVDKLFGDLKVDISETKRMLGWKPKVTMGEELERTAKWWREREK
jgi:UDP-glucose 4-epimerase